jgi:hypothetical protein
MRWLVRTIVCLLVLGTQPALLVGAPQEPATPPQDEHGMSAGETGPSLHVQGFTDINFLATDDSKAADGFNLGQFVAHVSASLGPKVSFFGETSFTARPTAFIVEVERAIIRYDFNDHLKISAGRYHTPINYWNTAFHHGLWLQTTIARPEMIQAANLFQPVHFVGVLAEGKISSATAGLGYDLGYGNGRGSTLNRAGDAGDVNHDRAWLAKLYSRPSALYGVEFGGAVYHDVLAVGNNTSAYSELISSAYVATTLERPEVIAEFAHTRHEDRATLHDFNSHAFYVQLAYRLAEQPRWKPYGRFEKMSVPDDPILGALTDTLSTAGVRFELTDMAALKAEYRHQRRPGLPNVNSLYVQAALVF